jgi:hypothetical protein
MKDARFAMPIISIDELLKSRQPSRFARSKITVNEQVNKGFEASPIPIGQPFDVFLSHSYDDRDWVQYLHRHLEQYGFSVYVDWIADRLLSRKLASAKTARILKQRMNKCQSLLFATSESAVKSVWMPWELGYFDGMKGRVAILPFSVHNNLPDDSFKGREFLGMYPLVVRHGTGKNAGLSVFKRPNSYVPLDWWLSGYDPEPMG